METLVLIKVLLKCCLNKRQFMGRVFCILAWRLFWFFFNSIQLNRELLPQMPSCGVTHCTTHSKAFSCDETLSTDLHL